ncbi:MAG: hypothetical protein E7005_01535 [Alphaproteobacteria bacterium]|nr:hypothetical protein [Alphaproteobacteria bacterium]
MDVSKKEKLLRNLWYVDENLKLTNDPTKSVGFIDLVLVKDAYAPYFVITFFERIGVAKSSIEARNLIDQWLKRKYGTHRLATRNTTFDPIIPLASSVAFCKENFAKHGREMEYCWVLEPFECKIHIDDINYRVDTAFPIKDARKFEETECGQIAYYHEFVHDVNEAFNVFPAVIIDYNEFLVHCQSHDLLDCNLYSNTHSLHCCNEGIMREYDFRQRTTPMFTVRIEGGSCNTPGEVWGAIDGNLNSF